MRLLFAGNFAWNCGPTQVVQCYITAGQRLGIDVAITPLGFVDTITAEHLPITDTIKSDDVLVLVFDWEFFLDEKKLAFIERSINRRRRIIIDADGRYDNYVTCPGDANHPHPEDLPVWNSRFRRLSDSILQPCLAPHCAGQRFLFFGMDTDPLPSREDHPEDYLWDLGYIGNNWFRWGDIVWLINGIEPIRHLVKIIGIRGMWWDGIPLQGLEAATYSDPHFLRRHNVHIGPSVPFGEVVDAMSMARIHPILVRPILATMQFVTPRMFETFAAGCIPILAPYLGYTSALYGEDVHALLLGADPGKLLTAILSEPQDYIALARHIRWKLSESHSYRNRIKELLDFVE